MRSVEVRSHKKDEAVSPVVGVMLMLVVTIVIAAVVAMFATGVFSETKAASNAVIELDGDATVGTDGAESNPVYWLRSLTFAHKGGDVLNLNELALKVTYNGSTTTTDAPFGSSGTWSVGEKQKLADKTSTPGYSVLGETPTYFTWSITDGSGLVIASGTKYFECGNATVPTFTVSWTDPEHATLSASYGSPSTPIVSGTTEIPYGETVNVTATCAEGYEVKSDGWSATGVTTSTPGVNSYSFGMPAQAVTVTATPSAKTFTVSFNMQNHGTQISSIENVSYGSKITAPTEPTDEGYTFGGWYKEEGCTNAWNFGSDTVTSNTTLYAKWTVEKYVLTFKPASDSPSGSKVRLSVGGETVQESESSIVISEIEYGTTVSFENEADNNYPIYINDDSMRSVEALYENSEIYTFVSWGDYFTESENYTIVGDTTFEYTVYPKLSLSFKKPYEGHSIFVEGILELDDPELTSAFTISGIPYNTPISISENKITIDEDGDLETEIYVGGCGEGFGNWTNISEDIEKVTSNITDIGYTGTFEVSFVSPDVNLIENQSGYIKVTIDGVSHTAWYGSDNEGNVSWTVDGATPQSSRAVVFSDVSYCTEIKVETGSNMYWGDHQYNVHYFYSGYDEVYMVDLNSNSTTTYTTNAINRELGIYGGT